jgi:tetratricopeptide (TPR) repeat protein
MLFATRSRAIRRAGMAVFLLALIAGLVGLALAAPTPPRASKDPPATPASSAETPRPDEAVSEADAQNRAFAEGEYKKGYKDVEEAKKSLASGKDAEAAKRFSKALKRFEEAVRLYEPYADAWNMIGFCSRHMGDVRGAFDAYDRALTIDPDHEEAHEYLGEAYVKVRNFGKAREQLEWLRARNSDEAGELAEVIERAEKTMADAKGAKGDPADAATAPDDSTSAR